ncbi:hypothetical protein SAMN04488072_102237 [Lentibacillus halodurans]|uniref:Uncharacterized protein n=1 Tax=Lentibacillus halodurans TaxID=237679 RepID=A0A1I0W5D3_9BACI|nr:hypothetical protein [Lentibacillus halodurans]SFA83959.1 hypothetical protein SAMN04488072_102237 [Lentibacillus halodurans]
MPALRQDRESCDSDTSHEEKVLSFFEDVANLVGGRTGRASAHNATGVEKL